MHPDEDGSELPLQPPSRTPRGGPVRQGHLRALEQLEDTAAYLEARRRLRETPGGVDVYLRPVNAGLTVMSLDVARCASMVGVGGRLSADCTVRTLPPEQGWVTDALARYQAKLATLTRRSDEERYSLELIAGALGGDLSIPLPGMSFVTQEWRLPSGTKVDLLCADPASQRLVVIELKDSERAARKGDPRKGGDAWQQARTYAAEIFAYRDALYPYFQSLGRALARAHGAPEAMGALTLNSTLAPTTWVSWPGGGFHVGASPE